MAFDLLYLDGHNLTKTALRMRHHLLEELISGRPESAIGFSESFEAGGGEILRASCDHGLEDIIARQLDGTYRPAALSEDGSIICW